MRLRRIAAVLILVTVVAVAGAFWAALTTEQRGDTVCGPVVTRKGAQAAACDDFYQVRQISVVALAAAGAATYVASTVLFRRDRKGLGRAPAGKGQPMTDAEDPTVPPEPDQRRDQPVDHDAEADVDAEAADHDAEADVDAEAADHDAEADADADADAEGSRVPSETDQQPESDVDAEAADHDADAEAGDPDVPPEPAQRLDPDAEADHLREMERRSKQIEGDADADLSLGGSGRTFADRGVRARVDETGDTDRPPADR